MELPRPQRDEFPVYYFFYGTLVNTTTLQCLLGHLDGPDTQYELHPASITGGILRTWGSGKYKALTDGPSTAVVRGAAFLVASEEHENALRSCETGVYEVVRCRIVLDSQEGGFVDGCTFRYVGTLDE